jgi:hypothetical protein
MAMKRRNSFDGPAPVEGAAGFGVYMVFVSENPTCPDAMLIEAKDELKRQENGELYAMKFSHYIVAHNWNEAMRKHHQKMGWEPYQPLE